MAKRIKSFTLDGGAVVDNSIGEALASMELLLVSALRRVEKGSLPSEDTLRKVSCLDRLIRAARDVVDDPGEARAIRDWLVASTGTGLPSTPSVRRLVEVVNGLVEDRHSIC